MAIYRFEAKVIARSQGHSATASAAYRAAQSIEDERTGTVFDYTRKRGVLYAEIITPPDTPAWMEDRAQLWNAVEKAEKRKDAQLARDLLLSLPHELTREQRRDLVREFVLMEFVAKGMIADVAIHAPDRGADERNHHAHVLLTMRELAGNGLALKYESGTRRRSLKHGASIGPTPSIATSVSTATRRASITAASPTRASIAKPMRLRCRPRLRLRRALPRPSHITRAITRWPDAAPPGCRCGAPAAIGSSPIRMSPRSSICRRASGSSASAISAKLSPGSLRRCHTYEDPARVQLVLQDFDRIALSNDSTSLLSFNADIGRMKSRTVGKWPEARGFETFLEERRFGSWTRRAEDEPGAALCGIDNALARAALDEAGFDLVVEAGLGAGPQAFRSISMHTFPASRSAAEIWSRRARLGFSHP